MDVGKRSFAEDYEADARKRGAAGEVVYAVEYRWTNWHDHQWDFVGVFATLETAQQHYYFEGAEPLVWRELDIVTPLYPRRWEAQRVVPFHDDDGIQVFRIGETALLQAPTSADDTTTPEGGQA